METPKWHWIVVKRLDSLLHPVKSLYFLCIFSMNRPKTHTINKTMILILLDDGCSNPPCRLSTFQLNWWKTHRVLLKISDSTSHLHTSDGTVLAEIKIQPEGKLHPKNSTVEYWNKESLHKPQDHNNKLSAPSSTFTHLLANHTLVPKIHFYTLSGRLKDIYKDWRVHIKQYC